MELIPGYDDWKTSPPEDPDPIAYCARCEAPLWEGDVMIRLNVRCAKSA